MNEPQEELEALERARLAAIGRGDAQAAAALLAEDYLHVNSTGRVIDKAAFLKSMSGRSRATTRGALRIRLYGDTAVMVGDQMNRTESPDGSETMASYVATQVARRGPDGWQLVLMQLTQKTPKN